MISKFTVRTLIAGLALTLIAGIPAMYGQVASPQLLPYQTSVVAGGGAALTAGAICPSKNISLDAYGDGCLATEVLLSAPRYVTEDSSGNIYFSDYGNKLIRKVNGPNATNNGVSTAGIITTVAGGGTIALPAGTACPGSSYTSADFQGDGCPATAVLLVHPTGVAIAPSGLVSAGLVSAGDIVFADIGNSTVRGISSTTGLIYNIAGNVTGAAATYGYAANVNEGGTAATGTAPNISTLDDPYGIHFDSVGNLFIAEEYKDAILVVNTSNSTTKVTGVSIPAGTIAKIAGAKSGGACPNGTGGSTVGCGYGLWVSGTSAISSTLDNSYDVTTDATGNVFLASEYYPAIGRVDATTGFLTTWAGTQTASATITNVRGPANTVSIGSNYGVAADANGNVYFSDSYMGWIWRVDAANQGIYVLAGATPASSIISEACQKDMYGDGCPASGTYFPAGAATATGTPPHPTASVGISGLFVDPSGTLLIANTLGNLVHKITTNANFGTIQPTNPVQNIEIHFGVGDTPSAYNLTTNSGNFSLGTPTCTTNSDTTTDCILPVTANPPFQNAGPAGFSSNLQVVSARNNTGNFTLSGILTLSQLASSTALTLSSISTNPVTPVTLKAAVTTQASSVPSGTVTFFSNGTQIGTPQALANGSASIQYTFPEGSYSVTAEYGGSLFLTDSTSTATTVNSVLPAFNLVWMNSLGTPNTTSTPMTVAQGQYGIGSLVITTTGGYNGTVNFTCSGLPANASCSFSPSSLVVGGTGVTSNTVALNIVTGATNKASLMKPVIPGAAYKMLLFCLLPGAAGMLVFGVRGGKRTRLPAIVLLAGIILVAAGFSGCAYNQAKTTPTPTGTYNVTVTATGTPNVVSTSANIVQTSNLSLTVTGY